MVWGQPPEPKRWSVVTFLHANSLQKNAENIPSLHLKQKTSIYIYIYTSKYLVDVGNIQTPFKNNVGEMQPLNQPTGTVVSLLIFPICM